MIYLMNFLLCESVKMRKSANNWQRYGHGMGVCTTSGAVPSASCRRALNSWWSGSTKRSDVCPKSSRRRAASVHTSSLVVWQPHSRTDGKWRKRVASDDRSCTLAAIIVQHRQRHSCERDRRSPVAARANWLPTSTGKWTAQVRTSAGLARG